MMQTFFTAAELAQIAKEAGLKNFPHTKRGVNILAGRDGWNGLSTNLTRKRHGAEGGGGMEYHFQLLPVDLQAVIAGQRIKQGAQARQAEEAERDRRQVAAVRAAALSAHARKVMEARAEVLLSIDGYAISKGETRAAGIRDFLEAQDAYFARQEIEARRDDGEILTDREAASLTKRLSLIAEDGFALDPVRISEANDRADKPMVKRSAIYDWFKARDERGVTALAPAPTKSDQPIPAGFAGFLRFYAIGSKPDATEALEEYLKTDPPAHLRLTLSQVRYVLRVKLNNIEKNIGREGILTLRSRLPYIQRTTDDMLPTTVYTADGKTFDAEIGDPVSGRPIRPEITSVLDVATRKCVGFALSRKENIGSVSEALRRASVEHGIPAVFYVDRGAGYKNRHFDGDAEAALGGLMGRLHIAKMHALPYNSQAKGIIERFNAHWNDLAKTLPSYIGADMDKEAGHKAHKVSRRELREIGVSRLLPSWERFVGLIEQKIREYNDTEHRGLPRFEDPMTGRMRHMTPNEAWAAHVAAGFEAILVHQDDADDLFRPYEIRTCRRALIEWNGNQYFHQDLEAHHDQRVMVGYDLHQGEKIWVREYDAQTQQPGRLICVATFSGNKTRYIAKSFEEKALEDRMRGQLKRLDAKRDAVIEQQRAPLIEASIVVPMPDMTRRADAIDAMPIQSIAPPEPRHAAAINSDVDLAKLCLNDPSQLTAGRARILDEILSRRNGRELLRISGVDLDALEGLLRSAA